MSERRLLERISLLENGGREGYEPQRNVLEESVTRYLVRILNTRQETALIDPKFGLPDLSNLGGGGLESGTIQPIAEQITGMVRRYEPRLKDVLVTFDQLDSSQMQVRFNISGNIEVNGGRLGLSLGCELAGNGKINFI